MYGDVLRSFLLMIVVFMCPTCLGMYLSHSTRQLCFMSVPRTCGDDPDLGLITILESIVFPYCKGIELMLVQSIQSLFPYCKGMIPMGVL